MRLVVKVGTSSSTDTSGRVDDDAVDKLCGEVQDECAAGHQVVVVTSGAIAAGLPAVGLATRPNDLATLQAVSAVGQHLLMRTWSDHLAARGLVAPRAHQQVL